MAKHNRDDPASSTAGAGRSFKSAWHSLLSLQSTGTALERSFQRRSETLHMMRFYVRELGIDVEIRPTNYNQFQEKLRRGDYQIFQFGWVADYPDPENFFFLLWSKMGKSAAGGKDKAESVDEKLEEWEEGNQTAARKAHATVFKVVTSKAAGSERSKAAAKEGVVCGFSPIQMENWAAAKQAAEGALSVLRTQCEETHWMRVSTMGLQCTILEALAYEAPSAETALVTALTTLASPSSSFRSPKPRPSPKTTATLGSRSFSEARRGSSPKTTPTPSPPSPSSSSKMRKRSQSRRSPPPSRRSSSWAFSTRCGRRASRRRAPRSIGC